jgi:hypothetical protein
MPHRQRTNPTLPHRFIPRTKGSRLACQLCGGQEDDQIHLRGKPKLWAPLPRPRRRW